MASRDLPLDIIHTILLNLPVKSLQRFKTVHKSWNAVISDHQFAKSHHQKSKNYRMQNLFICRRTVPPELCQFKYENRDLRLKTQPQPVGSDEVLCLGDGLVLSSMLTPEGKKDFVLWNPSSRKQERLGCPFSCVDPESHFGFCHDSNLDDFKVVIRFKAYYAVYSCKNKSWTGKQKMKYELLFPSAGLLVDGFSFWILKDEKYKPKDIIFFDPRDDKFKKLQQKPPKLLEGAAQRFNLTSLRGCLCSYENTIEENITRLRVWIMKGHVDSCSWSELLNIEIFPAVYPFDIIWPMLLSEKNEIVISLDSSGRSISLPKRPFQTLQFSGLGICCGLGICRDFSAVPYQDSLFFPIQDSVRAKRKRS